MYKVTLELETITPMFMYGAGEEPELRASEFKGMMRFWWRAAYGGDNIEEMKEREAEIFGSTEGKSKVRIVVEGNVRKGEDLKRLYKLDWEFRKNERRLIGKNRGIGYLFYSIVQGKKKFLREDQRFYVTLESQNEKYLVEALGTLWMALIFGGFGSRARRGGGNLNFIDFVEDSEEFLRKAKLNFKISAENIEMLEKWIKMEFKEVKRMINEEGGKGGNTYSNLNNAKILISQEGFEKWWEALTSIGNKYADFRYQNKHDLIGTAIFGLPRPHVSVKGRNINRRSSPIIIKVTKIPKLKKPYHWMVVQLGGVFLSSTDKLRYFKIIKEDGEFKRMEIVKSPSWYQLNNFWNQIKPLATEFSL